ncbi:hypothetical protein SCHPADRAFT_936686 [Schizopora paradoxa]|uniref:Metallo-beta-lactamase domain-containing protein n=1 Tax=Schizopora paradoxa TaxID=27342 RepID=A0A0H2S1V3_9AGAM|nr:hypothetical protein SCHPADRAFT_936686 [Schizopora paradoxa]
MEATAAPVLRRLVKNMSLTFLGTSSGGGPTISRNCTSTALTFRGFRFNESWLFDCAEGTQRQIQKLMSVYRVEPHKIRVQRKDISKIFVTHMHVDHVMGIVPLMNNLTPGYHTSTDKVRLQLYGPAGLRSFVRNNLRSCQVRLSAKYTVDELLTEHDPITSCEEGDLHPNEAPGRNILPDSKGLWNDFVSTSMPISVSAGPLIHRIPCIGYAITEVVSKPDDSVEWHPEPFRRKVVICGDCSDASGVSEIAKFPSVLVHEATKFSSRSDFFNIGEQRSGTEMLHKLESIVARRQPHRNGADDSSPAEEALTSNANEDNAANLTSNYQLYAKAHESAVASGHSTPSMAGAFAQSIGAHELFLNHISTQVRSYKSDNISEIKQQAREKFDGKVVVARDMLTVNVKYVLPTQRMPINEPIADPIGHMMQVEIDGLQSHTLPSQDSNASKQTRPNQDCFHEDQH